MTLLLGVALFWVAGLITDAYKLYYSPGRVSIRLTHEIANAISDLDTAASEVASQNLNNKAALLDFLDKNYQNAFPEKGIEILVYYNDSLRFWTSNVFAAPEVTDSFNLPAGVIHAGSGYYLARIHSANNYKVIALQLIKYDYKYSNDYLPTGFYKRFSAPPNANISFQAGANAIKGPEGNFLFSLTYDQPIELGIWLQYLVFTLYVSSFLLLVKVIFLLYLLLSTHFKRKGLLFLAFLFDIIILRLLQFYFRFPNDLYQVYLFNPTYYASSEFLPSLGDLLIHTILALQLVYIAYRNKVFFTKRIQPRGKQLNRNVFFVLLVVMAIFWGLSDIINGLVLNSSISFRFDNLLSLPHTSHIGVLIISLLLFAYLLFIELIGKLLLLWETRASHFLISALVNILVYIVASWFLNSFSLTNSLFLCCIFGVLFIKINQGKAATYQVGRIILLLVLLAAISTYQLNKAESDREHQKRVILATHLADARDNLAEYYFSEASRHIQEDKKIRQFFNRAYPDSAVGQMSNYINETYFSGYWSKYLIQITICQQDKNLVIKPGNVITSCENYFDNKVKQFLKPVPVQGLYFLRQSVDAMYYLGKIVINSGDSLHQKRNNIFVEISSNDIWKGLGYPELLYDNRNTQTDNLYGYSYAFYYKGELVKNVGKFSFDIDNRNLLSRKPIHGFYNFKGYNHYLFRADANTLVILSKELPRVSDLISPFSYIFLLLIILLFSINWLRDSGMGWKLGIYTFRLRLQLIMISSIVVSSLVLVTVSMLFINNLNSNKNNEILKEKLNSVLVDIETRYGRLSSFNTVSEEELSDLLLNLSNTYFTDINIYSPSGFLLASSRDQIFREGMISSQLNPVSKKLLVIDKKSFFIEHENIGSYTFLSAYTPVRNIDNHVLGYLNLPYFAKQEEIRREISGLISAFSNIYIIMIVITVMLALLLSRYITKPLQHIGNQFSRIKIGDKNEKIVWTRKDEIGRLVDEYNRMIDKLEKSAELLARSERESAWRQMARQVAHEIKNPLTPIKLSMQLLMRAWNDKAPDWEIRLKRFSQTLIMQIDTLSSIAAEFSDFAQMPEPQIQNFDIVPLVQQSAELFRDQSDCNITFETGLEECIVKADPNQILRVFNNLIKNALQAIPGDRQGIVKIILTIEKGSCKLSFRDNGTGIPSDWQTRIFSPNFTTKTAGMGLGLAMVKNIIDMSGGQIWFDTQPGEGTTFYVVLPMDGTQT